MPETPAAPKYVCYCSRVTEDDVIHAVREGGARDVDDVVRVTGAMGNPDCANKNPKGVCCHSDIAAVIRRVLGR